MRFYVYLYLLLAGIYLLTSSGRAGLSDSIAMLNVAWSMAEKGSLSSEPCAADLLNPIAGASVGCVPGLDENHYAAFGVIPSLAVTPVIFASKLASHFVRANPFVLSKVGAALFTALIAPLSCLVLSAWVLKLGYSRSNAVIVALIFALASPYWINSTTGFLSEPYFILALLPATYFLSARPRYGNALAGIAFGIACGTRLIGIITFPAFCLFIILSGRERNISFRQLIRGLFEFCVPLGLCLVVVGLLNFARFGSPLKTGYHLAFPSTSTLLSMPFFEGLYKLLFSGEVGLLVFTPWIVLAAASLPAFFRKHRPEAAFTALASVIFLLFFSKYTDSHGGWVAGPRMLLPLIPFLAATLAPTIEYLRSRSPNTARDRFALSSVFAVLVICSSLIQITASIAPVTRYYSLMLFYEHRSPKPWWYGSIPLAAVDYLRSPSFVSATPRNVQNFDQLKERRDREAASNRADSAVTEEDYLHNFPDQVNLVAPNLVWLKFGAVGIPAFVGILYVLTAIAFSLFGGLGLTRLREVCLDINRPSHGRA